MLANAWSASPRKAVIGSFQVLRATYPLVRSVSLQRGNAVMALDKRLDLTTWSDHHPIVAGGITIESRGKLLQGRVASGPATWPWIEMDYASGGKVIYCGYPLMSAWETNPTPRYIVARLLERVPLPEPEK